MKCSITNRRVSKMSIHITSMMVLFIFLSLQYIARLPVPLEPVSLIRYFVWGFHYNLFALSYLLLPWVMPAYLCACLPQLPASASDGSQSSDQPHWAGPPVSWLHTPAHHARKHHLTTTTGRCARPVLLKHRCADNKTFIHKIISLHLIHPSLSINNIFVFK